MVCCIKEAAVAFLETVVTYLHVPELPLDFAFWLLFMLKSINWGRTWLLDGVWFFFSSQFHLINSAAEVIFILQATSTMSVKPVLFWQYMNLFIKYL